MNQQSGNKVQGNETMILSEARPPLSKQETKRDSEASMCS